MHLTQDDDVIQTFSANGPNQSFGKFVLPWRTGRNRFVSNAHGCVYGKPHSIEEESESLNRAAHITIVSSPCARREERARRSAMGKGRRVPCAPAHSGPRSGEQSYGTATATHSYSS